MKLKIMTGDKMKTEYMTATDVNKRAEEFWERFRRENPSKTPKYLQPLIDKMLKTLTQPEFKIEMEKRIN